MSNNRLGGYEGHHIIVESIERLGGDLPNISRDLDRIATALERANEIYIDSHALPADVFEAVQADRRRRGTE